MVRTAGLELVHALGEKPVSQGPAPALPNADAFVLGRWKDGHALFPELNRSRVPAGDGFWLKTVRRGRAKYWLIICGSRPCVPYGPLVLFAPPAQPHAPPTPPPLPNPPPPLHPAHRPRTP